MTRRSLEVLAEARLRPQSRIEYLPDAMNSVLRTIGLAAPIAQATRHDETDNQAVGTGSAIP